MENKITAVYTDLIMKQWKRKNRFVTNKLDSVHQTKIPTKTSGQRLMSKFNIIF